MSPSLLVGLVLVLALLVAIPTRRLYLAGLRGWPLLAYFLLVLALGLLVAELRGPARYLVPVLVVAYLAPFVTLNEGIARLLGRAPPSPPRTIRNVTPPSEDDAPSEDPADRDPR